MSTIDRARKRAHPLAPRAVRMRNACVRHAAERLGLAPPGAEDLRALADDVTLRDAIEWWTVNAPGAVAATAPPRPGRLMLKTSLITAATLLGLALSYGRAQ